jgi:hypothetical protein
MLRCSIMSAWCPHFQWLTQLGLTTFYLKKKKIQKRKKQKTPLCFHFHFLSSLSPNFFPSTLSHHHCSAPTTTVQLRPPRSNADAHHPVNLPVWSFISFWFLFSSFFLFFFFFFSAICCFKSLWFLRFFFSFFLSAVLL